MTAPFSLHKRKDTLRATIIDIETDEASDPEVDPIESAKLWTAAYHEVCAATSHAELDRIEDWYDLPPTRRRKAISSQPASDHTAVSAPAPADTYSEIVVRLDDLRHTITVIYRDGHGKRAADPAVLGPYPAADWDAIRAATRRELRDLAAEHAAAYTEEVTT